MSDQNSIHEDNHHHGDRNHPGFDPERLLAMEERRRSFMPPEPVVEELISDPSWSLLDLGCGTGYYALPAARLLPKGRVFALDIQENMVSVTLDRARKAGLENVAGIVAPSSHIPLDEASVDAALVAMVYHDLPEQTETLDELRRIVKPGGIISMVEWDRVDSDFGPPMSIRISPPELEAALRAAGFTVSASKRSAVQPALYFLSARAPRS